MLEFIDLCKSFDEELICFLNFTLNKGERMAILGESGIGKTTILNLILGLDEEDSGEIKNTFEKIATVFQEDRLIDEISALDNLVLVTDRSESELIALLDELGISDHSQIVGLMSGGMKRRVSIARALAYGGDLFLLDEPIQGLDPENREKVIEIINRRVKGSSIILITHNLEDLKSFGIEKVIGLK